MVTPPGSVPHSYRAHYFDIVESQRIVFAYDMHIGEQRISVSLATVQFAAADTGTHMTFTEQIVFLNGYVDAGGAIRKHGTELQMEALERYLAG